MRPLRWTTAGHSQPATFDPIEASVNLQVDHAAIAERRHGAARLDRPAGDDVHLMQAIRQPVTIEIFREEVAIMQKICPSYSSRPFKPCDSL